MSRSDLHLWHPFTQEDVDPPPISIRSAKGVFLETLGRLPVDFWTQFRRGGSTFTATRIRQSHRLSPSKRRAWNTSSSRAFKSLPEELAVRLGKIVLAPLRHVFFSDDGSTAVEVALKLALQYWKNCGRPGKNRIVALENAYHGDTAGAMSVSDESPFTAAFDFLAHSRAAHALGVVLTLPRRPHACHLQDRMFE